VSLRFQAQFKHLDKDYRRIQSDNIRLIEEYNKLINEKQKLSRLRKLIKEVIKEMLGEEYDPKMLDSEDEEGIGAKRRLARAKSNA